MAKAVDKKPKTDKKSDPFYLITCLEFLNKVVESRLQSHFEGNQFELIALAKPKSHDQSPLAHFFRHYTPSNEEMIALLIALVPNVQPGFFDVLIQRFLQGGGDFPEFGGVKGQNHRGTLPTGETVLFILAGSDPQKRLSYFNLLDENSFLLKHKILTLQHPAQNEPALSGRVQLEKEFIEVFTTGKVGLPKLTMDFPAEHISTEMEWDDLVLNDHTMEQIREIEQWIEHNSTLMESWGMHKKLKPGYRTLFYGPPGTGKTLTATLLGKYTNRAVFRIDLSMVVSKYIGETEKILASLFERAEHKNWILFFDEADAIFGKRTGVRDAHDKYANQEIAYLLQRLEDYNGLVILSSNMRGNVDEAFGRRLQSIVHFPMPRSKDRLRLWKNSFSEKTELAGDVNLEWVSEKFELAGGSIINVVQYASLMSLDRGENIIRKDDLWEGIRKEYIKEGKSI